MSHEDSGPCADVNDDGSVGGLSASFVGFRAEHGSDYGTPDSRPNG